MPYTNRPFNPTTPYENQVEIELNKANDNFEILSQVFLNNDPTTGVLKSDIYTFRRVDLTNATSDYMLKVGEEAIINFTDATNIPLRISTQSGTYYECHLICSNTGGTSGATANRVLLNPNNTTYNNAFISVEYHRNASTSTNSANTLSAFMCGFAFSNSVFYITNFTQYKNVKGLIDAYGITTGFPYLIVFSADWRDTTTNWTSLGTIVFPQASSGYVLIKRLV